MYMNNSIYKNDLNRVLTMDLSFLKGKSIFITGASGLVGSFFVDTLIRFNETTNEKVDIYATFLSRDELQNRFPNNLNDEKFKAIFWDVTKPIQFDVYPDFILHTASLTHPKMYAEKPVETMKVNMLGTINVLDFAKRNPKCRVVFLSTMEVYGENNLQKASFSENDIGTFNFMSVRSCYPESKRVCETLTQCYVKEYSVSIMIARLGYVYGPTVQLSSSKADVQFLNNALKKENIIMKSMGEQKRSYCYVADIVSGLLTLFKKGVPGEAYNVASKEGNISLKHFADILTEIAGVSLVFEHPTEFEKQGYSNVRNSTLDASKLETLGWRPLFTTKEGIEHTFKIKKENLC